MRRYQKYLLVMTGAVLFAYAGAAGTAVYGQTDGRLAGQAVDGINGKEETGPGIGLRISTQRSLLRSRSLWEIYRLPRKRTV